MYSYFNFTDYCDYCRLNQCDGICINGQSCQPVKTKNIAILVQVTNTDGEKVNKTLVVQEHLQCQCDCIKKEEVKIIITYVYKSELSFTLMSQDCNEKQRYDKSGCGCPCKSSLNKSCQYDKNKYWNDDLCQCQCREEYECSTNYVFDYGICDCIFQPEER